ncbi:DNA repair protein RecO [Geotalea uraniireducens]|uniref:DNA repair protein RecO n=1 Tax=Geotalea uraniireducens TaxID=351604 RepID=A0ABM8EGZ3_9BACT|nr:DNA repair protein RecO [Geotalea uraniireducens]BDV41704.1 DNA repair protein RecO [Geotalea uraniireducens]
MDQCRCHAIVLAVMDFRDNDRIVTLCTLPHGKLRGVAKGAKKSVRRFGGALEPFAHLEVELTLREGLSSLHSADIVTVFPHIREDLLKIGHAGYAVELTDRLLPEAAPVPRLFRLLAAYLEYLDGATASPSDRRFFEVNLLNILGYRLALDHCGRCGVDLAPTAERRIGAAGAVHCPACGRTGRILSPPAVALLEGALRTGRFGVVNFPASLLPEVAPLIDGAIAAHLSRPLNSLTFLRQVDPDLGLSV